MILLVEPRVANHQGLHVMSEVVNIGSGGVAFPVPDPSAECGKPPLTVWIVAGLFMLLAGWLAGQLGPWTDEVFTLATTGHGVGVAWHQALHFELQPPLYFVVMSGWRAVSASLLWGRLFSVAAVGLTLVLACRLACPILGRRGAAGFVFLLALNPLVLWSAVQLRGYALVLLEVCLVLLAWRARYQRDGTSRGSRLVVVFASFALLMTQYYGGFLLAAGVLPLILRRRWRDAAEYAGLMAVVLAFSWPVLSHVPGQAAAHGAELGGTSGWRALRYLVWAVQAVTVPVSEALVVAGGWFSPARSLRLWDLTLRLGLALILATGLWRLGAATPSRWRAGTGVLLVLSAGLFASFVLLRTRLPEELLAERHLVVLLVPALLAGTAVASGAGRTAFTAWMLAAGASGVLVSWSRYGALANPGDSRHVAEWLAAHVQAGDVVFVFRAPLARAVALEYRGPARIVALPKPATFTVTRGYSMATGSPPVRDTLALAARVDSMARNANGAWLVSEPAPSYLGTDYHADWLDRVIQRRFRAEPAAVLHAGVRIERLLDH